MIVQSSNVYKHYLVKTVIVFFFPCGFNILVFISCKSELFCCHSVPLPIT